MSIQLELGVIGGGPGAKEPDEAEVAMTGQLKRQLGKTVSKPTEYSERCSF